MSATDNIQFRSPDKSAPSISHTNAFDTNGRAGNVTLPGLSDLNAVPLIYGCSDFKKEAVVEALELEKFNAQISLSHVSHGTSSPAYRVVFKSHSKERVIVSRYGVAATFPLVSGHRVKFICINNFQDADRYREFSTSLWANCQRPQYNAIPWAQERTLFICPSYFAAPDDSHDGAPRTCPAVQNNIFVDNDEMLRFQFTKSTTILHFVLHLYFRLPGGLPPPAAYITRMNDAIGWNLERAAEEAWSYLLFTFRMNLLRNRDLSRHVDLTVLLVVKNDCSQLPDISRPPWSSALQDNSTINATASETESLDSLQKLQSTRLVNGGRGSLSGGTHLESLTNTS